MWLLVTLCGLFCFVARAHFKSEREKREKEEAEKFNNSDEGLARKAGLVDGWGIPVGYALPYNRTSSSVPPPLTYKGDRHICTFGPNGTGKFTTTQSEVLLYSERSMFVIDPKGQQAAVTARRRREWFGQKVIVLNPFGLHGGEPWKLPRHKFNPLAALDPASDSFVADVSRLASAMIEADGGQSHWTDSAHDLFSWLIMWVILHEPEKTIPRVRDLLTLPENEFIKRAENAADSDFPPLRNKAAKFVTLNPELRGVISTAQTQTKIFDDPIIRESLSGSDFDFSELKRQKMTVYTVLPADYLESHKKWLRLVVVSALSAMYRAPDGEKVLFLLDEFAQLGYLADLEKAAGLLRGYGCQLWTFFQDYNQLESLYGKRAETFLANAGVIQVFTPNDMRTAEYFSKQSGTVIKHRQSWSSSSSGKNHNSSHSWSEQEAPKYSPHDLIGMGLEYHVLYIEGQREAFAAARCPYFRINDPNLFYDPDPYFKPPAA